MKMYLSAFISILLLLTLVGCSKEQFGSVPQSEKSSANGLEFFEQASCSNFTLIKPKVDILYVVDNSTSTLYMGPEIKETIKKTVDGISSQFDYRVIGTTLLPTDSTPNDDYQIMTNSSDLNGVPSAPRRINSTSEFSFFNLTANGVEKGMSRAYNFINNNRTNGLFRTDTHLLVILISNGRDSETETTFSNGSTQSSSFYATRLAELKSLKAVLSLKQLRFFSITARTQLDGGAACQSGWVTSLNSYVKASRDIYVFSEANDSYSNDSYDLCPQGGGLASVYSGVNNSIQQVLQHHKYKYWPMTFADANESILSFNDVKVYKYSGNAAPVEIAKSGNWNIFTNPNYPSASVNTRIEPTVGEPVAGKFFIEFVAGREIVHPDCVIVKSSSRIEYFEYIVISRPAVPASIVVRINGVDIPQSETNGWSYEGGPTSKNIKAGNANPPLIKSGYMIKLNGSANYYQSGDNVETYYTASGI